MRRALHIACVALALSGCASYDGYNLRPGTSRDEVVRTMGQPAMEFSEPDGSRELVYPRGPLGTQTFVADIGRDGALKSIRQVLTDGVFNDIRPGLTRDEILRMIGPPGDRMAFPLMQQDSWEYRYRDTWGYIAFFSVNFDRNGVVVSKFTRRLERNDSRGK